MERTRSGWRRLKSRWASVATVRSACDAPTGGFDGRQVYLVPRAM
jgi:hypothetical protein